jgi:DNA invertase Pin-like site-specific DNA recombinase
MGLEVSRLARNNADWQRLLEICAMTDTLILDEDGLYNPGHFNDRLLLGLKGTMSEAELHLLRARLQGGILNKARRGELEMRLPTGLVYDDTGKVVLDPDQQVRETISQLFVTFQRTGSAFGVVRHFHEKNLQFPGRVRSGSNAGELIWSPLYHYRVLQVLHNPRYAGAFVFGRTKTRKLPPEGKTRIRAVPQDQWKVILPNAHEGYIQWEEYQQNQKLLADNAAAYGLDRQRSPPGSGSALLQGMVVCGRCGRRMSVRYQMRCDISAPVYHCSRHGIDNATRICQYVQGLPVDDAIGQLLVQMVTPMSLEVAMQVFDEIRTRREEVVRVHKARLERARHEAGLAQQRFLRVDPRNRLVADTLERRWNDALRAVATIEEEVSRAATDQIPDLTSEQMIQIRKLAEDFPAVWDNPRTSARDRKRMIRLLIEDVTLFKADAIHIKIRFKGGKTKEMQVPIPLAAWQARQTAPAVVERIREMACTKTDNEITEQLNKEGVQSGTGIHFRGRSVQMLRRNYNIPGPYSYLRMKGFLTAEELADRIGVIPATVKKWGKIGVLRCQRYNDKGQVLYEDPGEILPKKWTRKKRSVGQSTSQNVSESSEGVQHEA